MSLCPLSIPPADKLFRWDKRRCDGKNRSLARTKWISFNINSAYQSVSFGRLELGIYPRSPCNFVRLIALIMSRPLSIPPPPPPPPPPSSQRQRAPYPDYDKATADESPWKYVGYRVFAKWMASEQTFFIVRRFGALNTRVILALQDEIVELEQQLNHLDEDYSRKDANENHTHNGSFRFDGFEDRRNLIQDILPEKLAKYSRTYSMK